MRSELVLRWVGVIASAMVGYELLALAPSGLYMLISTLVIASYALAFAWVTSPRAHGRPRVVAMLVVWQTLVATVFHTDLAYVLAMMLPFVYRRRTAAIWLVVRNVVGLPFFVFLVVEAAPSANGWVLVAGLLPHFIWQLFAFAIGLVAVTERQRREELAVVNHRLVATQRLLADRARVEERLDLSRDLHDSLGHHVAALNVQLELARQLVEGPALEAVGRAQGLGRELLGELRGVVSEWRIDSLPDALDRLAASIAVPVVRVTVASAITVDPVLARTLYRCAQELITNAVRHAEARHVWLELSASAGELRMTARDDGRGCAAIVPGNGLRGLRERVAAIGGALELSSREGHGFAVEIRVPA